MKYRGLVLTILAAAMIAAVTAAAAVPLTADETVRITLDNAFPGEVVVKAFTLNKESEIDLESAVGVFRQGGNELVFYGWILNSDTRQPVWHALDRDIEFDRGVNEISVSLKLPAGNYEMYYSAQLNNSGSVTGDSFGNVVSKILSEIFGTKDKSDDVRFSDELRLTVTADAADMVEKDVEELLDPKARKAVVAIMRVRDSSRVQRAFKLEKETRLHVYALGEHSGSNPDDYARIENMKTRESVWIMDEGETEHAGGAGKNVVADRDITLKPGEYLVTYVTDDSHAYNSWNQIGPHDPQFWGITVSTMAKEDLANVKVLENFKLPEPVVGVLRVRDESKEMKTFEVLEPVDLEVMCIGEGDTERDMYDYGWIEKAGTGDMVWKIKGRKTKHAGGAEKNRMLRERIRLEKGSYKIYFRTDRGHCYNDWNAEQPYDPDNYGITLWVLDEKDRGKISM